MRADLDVSDLRQIIRNLITFIIVEGKEYVKDDKKRDYVKGYVTLLSEIVGRMDNETQRSFIQDV